jgi:hypothetical protein
MAILITLIFPRMPSDAFVMKRKSNVVLYLDNELVEKSKSLGYNLSKKEKLKKMKLRTILFSSVF